MTMQPDTLAATLAAMRERAARLEQEAAALRGDLDEVAVLLAWEADHSVSSEVLQGIVVTEAEVVAYRKTLDAQFPDALLRLALQAQKAATRLKRSVPREKRGTANAAVVAALHQAAGGLGLTVPDELEALVGD